MMRIDPENPKLTAYVLGELDEADRLEIQQQLETCPESRAYVNDLRETVALLEAELGCSTETALSPAQRDSVVARAAEVDRRKVAVLPPRRATNTHNKRKRPWYLLPQVHAFAAVLVVAGTLMLATMLGQQDQPDADIRGLAAPHFGLSMLYDPANGTTSNGDVPRSGPEGDFLGDGWGDRHNQVSTYRYAETLPPDGSLNSNGPDYKLRLDGQQVAKADVLKEAMRELDYIGGGGAGSTISIDADGDLILGVQDVARVPGNSVGGVVAVAGKNMPVESLHALGYIGDGGPSPKAGDIPDIRSLNGASIGVMDLDEYAVDFYIYEPGTDAVSRSRYAEPVASEEATDGPTTVRVPLQLASADRVEALLKPIVDDDGDGMTDEDGISLGREPGSNDLVITGNNGRVVQELYGLARELDTPQLTARARERLLSEGVDETTIESFSGEAYAPIEDNPFLAAFDNPLSTFSIDVDTAAYSNVRRFLNDGQLPPKSAVRIEELINYFDYQYDPPASGGDPFAAHVEVAGCPWTPGHKLVRIGLKGREIDHSARPVANLVFLIDVSGSMSSANKLPLVQQGLKLLVQQLQPSDQVALTVYAGNSGLVLPPTPASDAAVINAAIDNLSAGGSTNGGEGIELAYNTAKDSFIQGGANRVILCTDGDFNVGITDRGQLIELIEKKREEGVFLSVFGFGTGNLQDATMEQLADKGNGTYAYVDSVDEAEKVFVTEAAGTLFTIAKDVKIQVEFNPTRVEAYRLIGYENRVLAAEDFNDDTKDAGEIGAGHTVTALYEVVPAGEKMELPSVDALKYQQPKTLTNDAYTEELLTLKLRYKQPEGDTSRLLEYPVADVDARFDWASSDFRFAASVAAFGMLLRDSEHKGDADCQKVHDWASGSLNSDPHGYRAEFLGLVDKATAILCGNPEEQQANHNNSSILVAIGETLDQIAARHNTTVEELMALNGLDSPEIRAGQRITVPVAE